MKLLNANLDAAAPKGSRPAKPDLHAFEFQGMRFLYDANSMGMAVLDDSDKDSAIPEHPLIGVQWKPVFPPNPSQDVRSLVLNVTHGCNLRCDYCLPPGTPILMSDFTHQPIEQLQVGDQVIGFSSSKKGKHSKLCISTVEAKSMRDAPLIRVETEDQEFLCTTDHHWYGDSRYRVAQVGRRISRVCSKPGCWYETDEYKQGYVRGLMSGDGYCDGNNVRIAMRDKEAIDRTDRFLQDILVPWTKKNPGHYRSDVSTEKIVRLRHAGSTWEEIARIMRCPINLVRGRWYRKQKQSSESPRNCHNVAYHRRDNPPSLPGYYTISSGCERTAFFFSDYSQEGHLEFQRGWIAGFFDAEGSKSKGRVVLYQKRNEHMKRALRYLKNAGFHAVVQRGPKIPYRRSKKIRYVYQIIVTTRIVDTIGFISWCQPAITRKKIGLLGRNNHCFTTPLKIIPVGRGPVFSLQTSTGNYVANGLLSKNCQVKNCIDDSDSMPPDVAIRAINFAFPKDDLPWGDGRMQARLSFFGGEPLLAWKTIVEAVRYFEGRSFPNRPKFSMTTNATLLDEARVQFLARHGFSLIVSLDGPEDVHDLHRKTVQGAGSFKDVLAALRLLQRANMGGRITLRSTYTPQTADRVQECTSYLNGLVREGLASHVSVEPSFLSESICKSEGALKFGIDGDAMARLEESYVLTARWFIQEILDGRKPVLHHFTKFLERLLWRLPQPSDCGASRGYITVGPRGDVFACHREAATGIGTIWNGFDESLRAPWYDNRLYCREGCPECSIRYLCGGGCRERSAASGNVRRPTGTECSLKRIWTMCTALIMASCPTETLVKIIRNPRAKKESGTAPGPTGAVCPHS